MLRNVCFAQDAGSSLATAPFLIDKAAPVNV